MQSIYDTYAYAIIVPIAILYIYIVNKRQR